MILSGWHKSVQQQFEMLLQTHCFSSSISFFFSRVVLYPRVLSGAFIIHFHFCSGHASNDQS